MIAAIVAVTACCSLGQVFSSEFFADPVSEGWQLSAEYCKPETWSAEGWYHQTLDLKACPPGPGGGADVYRRSLNSFSSAMDFFAEFRVQTNGNSSEIPGGAPVLLVLGNNAAVIYHVTVARDLVKFLRDVNLPILFIEVAPEVPHAYRVEVYPDRYAFYIDGDLIDEGKPDGQLLGFAPSISWRGRSWYLPCHNAWDYIRYGVLPVDGSGDYDSNKARTLFDYYFVHDCLTKDGPGVFSGPDQNAGPGCRFTDSDADADVDLLDFAEFQNHFTDLQ